jgi:hypothetical protein
MENEKQQEKPVEENEILKKLYEEQLSLHPEIYKNDGEN